MAKNKMEWLIERYNAGDNVQVIMFIENMLWAQAHQNIPKTESIEKYLLSDEGYSLNDMFNNK